MKFPEPPLNISSGALIFAQGISESLSDGEFLGEEEACGGWEPSNFEIWQSEAMQITI